jgi:hypothetical protein
VRLRGTCTSRKRAAVDARVRPARADSAGPQARLPRSRRSHHHRHSRWGGAGGTRRDRRELELRVGPRRGERFP